MTSPPQVQIVYNPRSGGYSSADIDALRAAFEARGAHVLLSPTSDRPIEIDSDTRRLCVAGGDGTLRHAADAVRRTGRAVPIGVYPSGTVNLLSREAGLRRDVDILADRLMGAAHREHYAVALDDALFLVCASVGPEAWAVTRVSLGLKRWMGRFAYGVALLPFLIRWPRTAIRLDIGGRIVDCEAFYVAKGRYFAGRWVLSSSARLTSPDMRLVMLRTARRRDMARFWLCLLLRRPVDSLSFVETTVCGAFSASAAAPLVVQADGDVVDTLPARFAVIPAPLVFA